MSDTFWRRTPIDTPRLRIRRFRPAYDATAMTAVYADPEVMRFIPGGAVAPDAIEAVLAKHRDDNEHGDSGFYAVEELESGVVVGEVGFGVFATGEPEVGWTFAHAFWGRGNAAEAMTAVLAERAGPLVAAVDAENDRSLRLAERLGLDRREEHCLHGRGHIVFELPGT